MTNLGIRGGTTMSLGHAMQLMQTWKASEFGWLQARILALAGERGEFHGEMLEEDPISEPNMIGTATRALTQRGLLAPTGEHRASRAPASHGRRSYVYRLTSQGRDLMLGWPDEMEQIADPDEPNEPPQAELF